MGDREDVLKGLVWITTTKGNGFIEFELVKGENGLFVLSLAFNVNVGTIRGHTGSEFTKEQLRIALGDVYYTNNKRDGLGEKKLFTEWIDEQLAA